MTTMQLTGSFSTTERSEAAEYSKVSSDADYELETAFSELVDEYSSLSYNVALRMLRNPEDAEDAVQDAFVSAYKAFSRFKGESKPSTWLYRIVVNACLMKIRKNKTRARYMSDSSYEDAIVYDRSNDPETNAANGELRHSIEDAMGRLAPDLRAAVVLRDVQGLSSEEAADVLDISVAALKSRLHRARLILRKRLEDVWQEVNV